jgi:hypothetical protein
MNASLVLLAVSSAFQLSSPASIEFHSSVPDAQKKLMRNDLQRLESFRLMPDAELESKLGLERTDATALQTWLETRVKHVVGEKYDLKSKLTIMKRFASYPNNEMPEVETNDSPDPEGKGVTVMSNIGSAVYFAGKKMNSLLGLKLGGLLDSKKVEINSPRAGVIQVGEGLFLDRLLPSPGKPDAMANSVSRLSTFFHEARHSDGSGKHLGFFHALCPEGHDFAGRNACDRNRNGPYTVGALTERTLLEACTDCSEGEKEKLRLSIADSFSRVIEFEKEKPVNTNTNASVIRMIEIQLDLYRKYPDLADAAKIADLERQLKELQNSASAGPTPTGDWDASPEAVL